MNKVAKVLVGVTMMAGLFVTNVEVNDAGMMIDFQDNTGLWYELDDEELTEHLYDLAKSLKGIVNKRLSAER